LFPKQAANSLVTETLQYFVFFCRSVYYAIFAKCLIINDLRLILVILFFIAFLNFTYLARKTFASTILLNNDVPIEIVSKLLGHSSIRVTEAAYAQVMNKNTSRHMNQLKQKLYTEEN